MNKKQLKEFNKWFKSIGYYEPIKPVRFYKPDNLTQAKYQVIERERYERTMTLYEANKRVAMLAWEFLLKEGEGK